MTIINITPRPEDMTVGFYVEIRPMGDHYDILKGGWTGAMRVIGTIDRHSTDSGMWGVHMIEGGSSEYHCVPLHDAMKEAIKLANSVA